MTEAYYPRHGGEQGLSAEELQVDALQARVDRQAQLLREVVADYMPCPIPEECRCLSARIQAELEVPHAE